MGLILRRKSLRVWTNEFNGRPVYISPKSNFNTPNETFLIIEQFGSRIGVYNETTNQVEGVPVADITVYDDLNSGPAETFATVKDLSLRLEELLYPAFYRDGEIMSIAGYIQAGSGVTITGTGSLLDPFIVSASGGGSGATPHNAKVAWVSGTITVPSGFTGIITNLNDINAIVTFTVSTTNLTLTGGVTSGDVLLINGKY